MATLVDSTTVRDKGYDTMGSRRVRFRDLTFSNSYTTGGEAVTLSDLGMKIGISHIQIEPVTVGAVHYRFEYDRPNAKVIAYNAGTGAEIANATDLSGVTTRVWVVGK